MIDVEPHLLVRAASVYVAAVATAGAVVWRRPSRHLAVAAVLCSLWAALPLLAINVVAVRVGWWTYDAAGGVFAGVPLDLLLAWAALWGAVPLLAWERAPLWLLAPAALALDLVTMPWAGPVVRLASGWRLGDAVAVASVFIPGQLFGRWTARNTHLAARTTLQMLWFAVFLVLLLPGAAIEYTSSWSRLQAFSPGQISLVVQALAVPAVCGLTAVQEFVVRGAGTPVPFDPPSRLVTTGIYRYVRNPMQLSALLLLVLIALFLGNLYLLGGAAMAHLYSVGLAGWDEDADLAARFGDRWREYRNSVRRWIPRTRPWTPAHGPISRLYVSEECGMCRQVGRWFGKRAAADLIVVAAETHANRLTRITYEAGEDGRVESGVAAVARALEHVHVGWAFAGFAIRLPIVLTLVQWLVDACGGAPRQIQTRCDTGQTRGARRAG